MDTRKDEIPGPAPHEHWRVDDPAVAPPHAEIISPARAVEEALATLGCGASDEEVCRHLREREGMDIGLEMIARVREELARSKNVCGE